MTAPAITVSVDAQGVATLRYDVPGEAVNTLRPDFADAFLQALAEVADHPDARAAVLVSGKPDGFIAGADVKMLDALHRAEDAAALSRRGHEVTAKLAAADKPVVAAVHGAALGGGFEVALACAGRVLSDSPKTVLGLPEVQLGLVPAASGLQRLAEIAGLQVALDYGLTGKNMRPDKARKLGVADDVVPRAILERVAGELALAIADERAAGKSARRRSAVAPLFSASPDGSRLQTLALEKNPIGRAVLFKKAREQIERKTGGHYPAAAKIIEVLETYAARGLTASQEVEARAFGELVASEVSRNLRGIFFGQTALKKDSGGCEGAKARKVTKIGVLGAGLMGAGIAYASIDKGFEVRLKDKDFLALGRGLRAISGILDERVAKKQLSRRDKAQILARLSTTIDYRGFKRAELTIEAVFEDLELKRRTLAELEEAAPGAIFASNTSSIPIGRIAEGAKAPDRVVGMHYFSPVHKMPLCEVIRAEKTSDEVVATAAAVAKAQGKTVIVVNDGVGFYTSRVLAPYMNEASYLLCEGVPVDAIDRAMIAWGWPLGPLALVDEVGIDVAAHVGPIMVAAFGERMTPPPTIARLVDDGRKGKKNGKGFYRYGAGRGKDKEVDDSVYAALGLAAPKRSPVSIAEIQERCNLQLVNEALHCFGERIVRSARDGDIGAVFGLGFPPFRGGPFRYVDHLGAATVLDRIRHFRDRFGHRFDAAPALVEMAHSGKRFHA